MIQDDLEKCGAVYPLDPSITCTLPGKCRIDAHVGIQHHPTGHYSEYVAWGTAFDDPNIPRFFFRILTLDPAEPSQEDAQKEETIEGAQTKIDALLGELVHHAQVYGNMVAGTYTAEGMERCNAARKNLDNARDALEREIRLMEDRIRYLETSLEGAGKDSPTPLTIRFWRDILRKRESMLK